MADVFTIHVKAAELGRIAQDVERTARLALREAANPVLSQVRDFTPRWRGGLVRSASIREEEGGRAQTVYMTNSVVAQVHENNGRWSKWPPREPIQAWVSGKLGLSGAAGARATFAIRRKIFQRGLTLPNVEGRGQMFKRTLNLMRQTRAHFRAFKVAFSRLFTTAG
jgi:hypothetical protein